MAQPSIAAVESERALEEHRRTYVYGSCFGCGGSIRQSRAGAASFVEVSPTYGVRIRYHSRCAPRRALEASRDAKRKFPGFSTQTVAPGHQFVDSVEDFNSVHDITFLMLHGARAHHC